MKFGNQFDCRSRHLVFSASSGAMGGAAQAYVSIMVLAAMALPPWGVGGRAATASAASPPLPPPALPPEAAVLAAYYLWYGNPEFDGDYKHWNHEVLPHWAEETRRRFPHGERFRPPRDLHAPFYPARGPYSSSDPALLRAHMRELRAAGVGGVIASWWGPQWRAGTTDTQGVSTDAALPRLLEAADAEGVKVAIHLEPYVGRNATTVREDLAHLAARCGAAPALLRLGGRPLFFVYDSYHIQPADWAELLSPGGARTVRGTPLDGVFVGLWLRSGDGDRRLLPSGFDGFYTYFASEAVSYGAQRANWPAMAAWARKHGKLFFPSVGPGYNDEKIRPWNAAATRGREGGALYRTAWRAALDVAPDGVTITSYNEWGEGTQIEPALSEPPPSDAWYQSYGDRPEDAQLYLDITASCTKQFAAQREERRRQQQRAERERGAGGGRPVDEL